MDTDALKQFIYKASRATYASGDESLQEKQLDGSTTIRFVEGNFSFYDNYFGGEPYGGREVVFYEGKAAWMMVYYGSVLEGSNGEVYTFLMKALSNNTVDIPYRGPAMFRDGVWTYENEVVGDVERFSGKEYIAKDGIRVYEAQYIGGFVNR
jgi:hypothetical protein